MRKSIPSPLSCFGLEYSPANEVCQQCKFQKDCRKYMGRRENRVTLGHAEFQLTPGSLEYGVEAFNFVGMYRVAYERVFDHPAPPVNLKTLKAKFPDFQKTLLELAKSLNVGVETYITASMMAFDSRNIEGRVFNPQILFRPSNAKQIEKYKKFAIKEMGTFDAGSLETLIYGESTESISSRLLRSEIVAGEWIVGYKIRNAGSGIKHLYEARELSLDPIWLATEESYWELILKGDTVRGADSVSNHRHAVNRIRRLLKKDGQAQHAKARYVFELRNKIMPRAVETVLSRHGLHPDDLEREATPVTNSLQMWERVGLAIQHLRCLEYLELGTDLRF